MNSTTTERLESAADQAHGYAERAAERAERMVDNGRRSAHNALDALHQGVDDLGNTVPNALHRAAGQVDELTRRSIEQARATARQVRDQMHLAGDRTVTYIKDEPVKSMLIAAAAGAVFAAVATMLTRSRRD